MQNYSIRQILQSGGIAIFPTDTAFGIGGRIDKQETVDRLFLIKKRSLHKPTPVLVSSVAMAMEWVDSVSDTVQELMQLYWPGGLTIILPSSNPRIVEQVTAGTGTLGVRVPAHSELREIIEELQVPIIGSSANFEGLPTPYNQEDLDPELIQAVDGVMQGECTTKQASTVIDCTKNPFIIVRQGAVQVPEKYLS